MKKSRTTTIIVSLLLVLALLAGLLVATYALFTDEERVNNHLQAGNLDIELQIDSVKGNGYVDGVLEDDIDYTPANTNDKIFNSDNFFPAMYQEATLTLLNNGSLPFDYTLEFEITKDSGLAKYIDVTVTDKDGKEFVPVGGTLDQIAGIDVTAARELLKDVELTAMCDIDNPMYGERGAAYIFGPQKGADDEMVKLLDNQLRAMDAAIIRCLGLHVADLPGAGAAGAFGAGCVAFLGAKLKSGIETVLDTVEFDRRMAGADVVFTGEGRIDSQSVHGKVIDGISRRTTKAGVPLVAIVGDVRDDAYEAYDIGVTAIFSINRLAIPFSEARPRSRQDYIRTFEDVLRLI